MSDLYNLDKLAKVAHANPTEIKNWENILNYCQVMYRDENVGKLMDDKKEIIEVIRPYTQFVKVFSQRMARSEASVEHYSLYKDVVFFEAPFLFDSYMLACEWYRTPAARFYLPRRNVLEGKHKLISSIQNFVDDPSYRFLGLSMPPGCGKSTIIKFLLAWISGSRPESANMYLSYSDAMVKMILSAVHDIVTNEDEYAHKEIFPELKEPAISRETSYISYRGIGDFATLSFVPIEGGITGRTRANRFLVCDDLVKNAEMVRSLDRMEKLNSDYRNTIVSRTVGETVKQIMLGTLWSIHDPLSRKHDESLVEDDHMFVKVPVRDEEGHSNFNYDPPVTDKYTEESIRNIEKDVEEDYFSALYMCEPYEKVGRVFEASKLRYYEGDLPDGEPDRISLFADVAWGGGDNFSMPIAYTYGEDTYIHDVIYDKSSKDVTRPRVIAAILRNKVNTGVFEANNGGDEYCDIVSSELRGKHAYRCHIWSEKAPGNAAKATRIEQYQSEIKNFYFRKRGFRSNEYDRFMKDLTSYSFTGMNVNDDAPDSLAGLAKHITAGQYAKVKATKRRF